MSESVLPVGMADANGVPVRQSKQPPAGHLIERALEAVVAHANESNCRVPKLRTKMSAL